jgi:mannosyl-oligosaccharide alpha-1,2-mannosidase
VKASFKRCWDSYRKHAWKKDELKPVSGEWRTTFGGWGATLVDSLDTLLIMKMTDEFNEAVVAIKEIDFKPEGTVNMLRSRFGIWAA